MIKNVWGVPVLAHSGFYDTDFVVEVCVNAGNEIKYQMNPQTMNVKASYF